MKICKFCNSNFEPIKFNQLFCTENCRNKFHNEKSGKLELLAEKRIIERLDELEEGRALPPFVPFTMQSDLDHTFYQAP